MTGSVRVTGAVPGRQSAVWIKCDANKKHIDIQSQNIYEESFNYQKNVQYHCHTIRNHSYLCRRS